MATIKRVFTLRLSDEVHDKIGKFAAAEHRSMTNYIEHILFVHIQRCECEHQKTKSTISDKISDKSTLK